MLLAKYLDHRLLSSSFLIRKVSSSESALSLSNSIEQQLVYERFKNGDNLFISGPGGSGKSSIIKQLKTKHSNSKNVQVCALTGCAAVLLNCRAKTLHSWAGIGLGNGSVEENIKKVRLSFPSRRKWLTTDVLIVDEVSMLSLKLFNMLNLIAQAIRRNTKPFGGIQIVFSGDFYQLPPVGTPNDVDSWRYCFESNDWNLLFRKECQVQLTKIYRQTDPIYASALNKIRQGCVDVETVQILKQCVGRRPPPSLSQVVVEPTKLLPTKEKVNFINDSRMFALKGEEKVFEAIDMLDLKCSDKAKRSKSTDSHINLELTHLIGNLRCEKSLKLKVGAQVMCIANLSSHSGLIYNGSQGVVTQFVQGSPLVKYHNGLEVLMTRHVWESENIPGIGVSQVPLILAWALTKHKSQGSTLDTAEIDVGSGIFECGQTYVALSRVKSMENLCLTSFDEKKIKINEKVKQFYDSLEV